MLHAFLAQEVPRGQLRQVVEERFARVKDQMSGDGNPVVLSHCLAGSSEVSVTLPHGVRAIVRYLPNRQALQPQSVSPGHPNWGVLLWFALADAPAYPYLVKPRRRPNTERHLTLVDPQQNAQKLQHLNQLRAATLFLFGIGPGYSGIFNETAAGEPQSLHFQYFGEPLPLWTELEGGRVTVANRHTVSFGVSVGELSGWPFTAPVFESTDPEALAGAVWEEIERYRSGTPSGSGLTCTTDLLLSHSDDGMLRLIAVRRDWNKRQPKSFYGDCAAFGNFGGLELCGLVMTIKAETAFQALATDPSTLAKNLDEALRETSTL